MRAQREGYDASLVVNRHVLLRLAQQAPRSHAALAQIEGLLPWQVEAFGADLVETIAAAVAALERDPPSRGRRRASRTRHA